MLGSVSDLGGRWSTVPLTPDIVQLGSQLAKAAADGVMIKETPKWLPGDLETAYATQVAGVEAAVQNHNQELVGWKIGATNKAGQERLGVSGPFFGPIYRSNLKPTTHASGGSLRGIEGEFGFRIGVDMPVRPEPWLPHDVAHCVKEVIPTVEIIASRFANAELRKNVWALIADQAGNGSLVLAPEPHYQYMDVQIQAISVRVYVNGKEVADGDSQEVLGHPIIALTWLANTLRRRGVGLKAGQIVSTGTCTGVTPIAPGDDVRVSYDVGKTNFATIAVKFD